MSFENPFGKTNIPKSDAEKKADELKDGVVKNAADDQLAAEDAMTRALYDKDSRG